MGLLPAVVWRTIASYLGWWTCASWAVMTTTVIAMSKVGTTSLT